MARSTTWRAILFMNTVLVGTSCGRQFGFHPKTTALPVTLPKTNDPTTGSTTTEAIEYLKFFFIGVGTIATIAFFVLLLLLLINRTDELKLEASMNAEQKAAA